METNKIFVGGISWNLDNQDLNDIFSEFGEIKSIYIVKDKETKKSRGFGFVEFTTVESAVSAKKSMDGAEVDGRNIKVDFAQDKR